MQQPWTVAADAVIIIYCPSIQYRRHSGGGGSNPIQSNPKGAALNQP